MELIKNGNIIMENAGNEISCPHCKSTNNLSYSDILIERINDSRGRCSYLYYFYYCFYCNNKIKISQEEIKHLETIHDYWKEREKMQCCNCKTNVEVFPHMVCKMRKGFMRYSKRRMWECPLCGQNNYVHKSIFSPHFNRKIKRVITVKRINKS